MSAKVATRLNWIRNVQASFEAMRAKVDCADKTTGGIFSEDEAQDVQRCLDDLEAIIGVAKLRIGDEYMKYYSQFDRVAILQPLVRCGDVERRIVVNKPRLPKRDEPYIQKQLHDVLLRQMDGVEIVNLGGYDIEVIDKGKAVCRIKAAY